MVPPQDGSYTGYNPEATADWATLKRTGNDRSCCPSFFSDHVEAMAVQVSSENQILDKRHNFL